MSCHERDKEVKPVGKDEDPLTGRLGTISWRDRTALFDFSHMFLWRRMRIQRSLCLWSLCQCEEPRRNEELDEGSGLQGSQWGTLNHPWHEDTDSGSPLIPAANTRLCIPPLLPFLLSFQDLISSLFQPWAVQSLTAPSESLHVFALVHVHCPFHTFHVFYYISPVLSTSYLGNRS